MMLYNMLRTSKSIKGDPTPAGFQQIPCQLHPSPVTRPNCKQQLHGRRCQWIDQGAMSGRTAPPSWPVAWSMINID